MGSDLGHSPTLTQSAPVVTPQMNDLLKHVLRRRIHDISVDRMFPQAISGRPVLSPHMRTDVMKLAVTSECGSADHHAGVPAATSPQPSAGQVLANWFEIVEPP